MNASHIQNLRYKLQKRFRQLNSADLRFFHPALRQFWNFLQDNVFLGGILRDLEARGINSQPDAQTLLTEQVPIVCDTEEENISVCYFIVKACTEAEDENLAFNVVCSYRMDSNDVLQGFKTLFVEPLYEYLDEQLDDQGAILALLKRYKHKCEWFAQQHLYDLWMSNTDVGESKLANHLYEYLFDQGVEFSIEPRSIVGEVDLIAAQNSDDPLIADAKVYGPSTTKHYVAKGVSQIYAYTRTYNEPVGYLVIFITAETDLSFALSGADQSFPFLTHNHKTIFLITVDIFPSAPSASKRGKIRTLQIDEEYLIQHIEENLKTDVVEPNLTEL